MGLYTVLVFFFMTSLSIIGSSFIDLIRTDSNAFFLMAKYIILSTKVHLVKAVVFPVIMYGYESWTIKKAEHRRIDASELSVGKDSWESLEVQGDPTSPP